MLIPITCCIATFLFGAWVGYEIGAAPFDFELWPEPIKDAHVLKIAEYRRQMGGRQ